MNKIHWQKDRPFKVMSEERVKHLELIGNRVENANHSVTCALLPASHGASPSLRASVSLNRGGQA